MLFYLDSKKLFRFLIVFIYLVAFFNYSLTEHYIRVMTLVYAKYGTTY